MIKTIMPMKELYLELEKRGFRIKESKEYKNPKNEYNFIKINGYTISESKYIWEKYNGKIPEGFIIHHINGNKKDNRIENLQLVTFNEHMNMHKRLKLLSNA